MSIIGQIGLNHHQLSIMMESVYLIYMFMLDLICSYLFLFIIFFILLSFKVCIDSSCELAHGWCTSDSCIHLHNLCMFAQVIQVFVVWAVFIVLCIMKLLFQLCRYVWRNLQLYCAFYDSSCSLWNVSVYI